MSIRNVSVVFVVLGGFFVLCPLFLNSLMEMTSEDKLSLLYSGFAFVGVGLFGFLVNNCMNSMERNLEDQISSIWREMDDSTERLRRDCDEKNREVYQSIDHLWAAQEKKTSR